MTINGKYLEEKRKNLGLDQNQLAKLLDWKKHKVSDYEMHPEIPLKTEDVEKLLYFLFKQQSPQDEAKPILESLLSEFHEENHSFSPNKILAHPEIIGKLFCDEWNVHPFLVEIHLTNECTHQCPLCTFADIHHNKDRERQSFDKDRLFSLLEELKANGTRAIFWSGGGDPLMYPHVEEVFKKAAECGFQQILITNGSNLDKVDNDFLVRNFSTVRVSLDAHTDHGFKLTHGSPNRDAAAEFYKIRGNIVKLAEAFRKCPVNERNADMNKTGIGVSFLIHKGNKDEVVGFCTMARDDLKVQYVAIKPIVHERNEDNDKMLEELITKDFADALRTARERNNNKLQFRVFTLEHKFLDMLSDNYGKTYSKCLAHPLYPSISADGGVYPCCLMIGKDGLCYGNVNNQTFQQIWLGDNRKQAVNNIDIAVCPINCKLSETNKTLEIVRRARELSLPDYLN